MIKTASNTPARTEADGQGKDSVQAKTIGRQSTDTDCALNSEGQLSEYLGHQAAESRQDAITGQWTIFAPSRQQRPDQYQSSLSNESATSVDCPFCGGAEQQTPHAVWVGKLVEDKSASGDAQPLIVTEDRLKPEAECDWAVRVVPNKYPAISPPETCSQVANGAKSELFPCKGVVGGHEVIVESPRHVESLTDLDLSELALVFTAYRERMATWFNTPGIRYISLFKNVRGQAGASLAHSHSQLIATDLVPTQIQTISKRLAKYRAKTGCCLQCDLLRSELKQESRIVAKSNDLVAYCPYGSPLPMLVRITSQVHQERFDLLDDDAIESVSRLVFRVISWLEKLHPQIAYNMLVHSRPPYLQEGRDTHHWSIDIFPRLTRQAGFEFGSSCMINPMLPEVAAQRYRACAQAEDPRRL